METTPKYRTCDGLGHRVRCDAHLADLAPTAGLEPYTVQAAGRTWQTLTNGPALYDCEVCHPALVTATEATELEEVMAAQPLDAAVTGRGHLVVTSTGREWEVWRDLARTTARPDLVLMGVGF